MPAIATPRSAAAMAGASLTPSPTGNTRCPAACIALTRSTSSAAMRSAAPGLPPMSRTAWHRSGWPRPGRWRGRRGVAGRPGRGPRPARRRAARRSRSARRSRGGRGRWVTARPDTGSPAATRTNGTLGRCVTRLPRRPASDDYTVLSALEHTTRSRGRSGESTALPRDHVCGG